MPLSITNKSHLAQDEILALTTCNLSRELVAIQLDAVGGPKIVKLSREQVNCWQLFLRMFGSGQLANMKVHLTDVAAHLNRYDWSEAKGLSIDSDLDQAYSKACVLANKALLHKQDETLFNNVAIERVDKKVGFSQWQGSQLINRHNISRTVNWNPFIQVKHIKSLFVTDHSLATGYSNIRIEDENDQALSNEANVSLTSLKTMRIYVERRLVKPEPEVVVVTAPKQKKKRRLKDTRSRQIRF